MASKIYTTDLKVGMFVADLDRPWVDTPFLLQGFLIENEEQILALKTHCDYVMVDRARSTGAEFEAPAAVDVGGIRAPSSSARGTPAPTPASHKAPAPSETAAAPRKPRVRSDGSPMTTARFPASVPYRSRASTAAAGDDDEPGLF